ncbi:MAG: VWA domain-containing protein [Deltaproteobacteria bacterium]|nr:VWA domain-containing protein [Deltaproteobacteria bacterium]
MRDLTFKISATASRAFTRSGDVVDESAARFSSKVGEWPSFVRETFGRLYRPQDADRSLTSPEAWASRATEHLTTSPEWREAALASRSHRLVAAETAARLADGIGRVLGLDALPDNDAAADPATAERAARRALDGQAEAQERYRRANDDADSVAAVEAAEDVAGFGAAARSAQALAARGRARRAVMEATMRERASDLAQVVAQASKEAQATAAAIGLLAGAGVGGDGEEGEIDEALVKLARESADVRAILAEVGRERQAQAKRAGSTTGGRLDVVGVDGGRDVFSLASVEMMRLSAGGLSRLDVLARAEQGAALVVQRRGESPATGGDFVLLVDRSGSMAGERQRAARAFSMGAILRAMSERRRVIVVAFDDGPAARAIVERDGRGLADAAKALLLPARGGTDAVGAMREACAALSPNERAKVDTLIVTDGYWQDPTTEQLRALRRGGGTFKAVLVDGAGERKAWLDGAWTMDAQGKIAVA